MSSDSRAFRSKVGFISDVVRFATVANHLSLLTALTISGRLAEAGIPCIEVEPQFSDYGVRRSHSQTGRRVIPGLNFT